MKGDPRITLARPDLASSALEGLVSAARYVEPTPMQCSAPVAAIRKAADAGAEQVDQLLFGEGFEVLEEANGFAFGQAQRDGYVGYVDLEALSAPVLAPTHRVAALRTYAFAEANLKMPPVALLSMNGLVTVDAVEGRYAKAERSGWIIADHLKPTEEGFETDPAGVGERFVGAPYLWGGRESLGLDCSGLVQQALYACGRACPRDSDQQQALGEALDIGSDLKGLRRGDLVFWRGHVGIMLDGGGLLHANGHHMATAIEPLSEAVARIEAAGSGRPTAFRRL
jgi:cell wall-associated NlpC family hydrolase